MKLLTIKDAADALQMSQGWIKKAIREGELPVIRFGRSVRIFEEQLVRYCKKFEGTTESLEGSPQESSVQAFQDKSAGYRL